MNDITAQLEQKCGALLRANRDSDATATCNELLSVAPNNEIAMYYHGVIHARAQRWKDALEWLRKSISQRPEYHEPCFVAAYILGSQKRTAEAATYLKKGITSLFRLATPASDYGNWLVELASALFSTDPRVWSDYRNSVMQLARDSGRVNWAGNPDLLRQIYSLCARQIKNPHFSFCLEALLVALGFEKDAPAEQSEAIFTHICVPLIRASLEADEFNKAFDVEDIAYARHIKTKETEAHFQACYAPLVPIFRQHGARLGTQLPPRPSHIDATSKNQLAFFLHYASMLAHVQLLLNTIRGMRAAEQPCFEMVVFVLDGRDEKMELAFGELGVRLVFLEDGGKEFRNDTMQKLLLCRQLIQDWNIATVVWISAAVLLPFAFSMRMAPVQIWWAMKYHSLDLPEIDGYVTGYSITNYKMIGTRRWRTAPYGIADWYNPLLGDEARKLRQETLPNFSTVLGCFGREEKLDSPAFVKAVARILQSNPNCVFLWTGKQRLASIQRIFDEAGVQDRCRFIGWVNTKLYAQIIDIFLDSYPFPCGYTAFEAMAARKPVLFYTSPEAYETGIFGLIDPILKGNSGSEAEVQDIRRIFGGVNGEILFPAATDDAGYVAIADRLIRDPDYRKKVGGANGEFMDKYVSSPQKMGLGYANHFREIIDEQARKHA